MFKIGEFSKLTQVSARMLRYYDETGLLKPAVIDSWTGYRMYSAEQIPVLNKIIYLRDSGFQRAEIAYALKQDNGTSIMEQLDHKRLEIEADIQQLQAKLKKIDTAKTELLRGQSEIHYNISIKSIPRYFVLSLRRIVSDYYAEGDLWKELSEFVVQNKIEVSSNTFSLYHDEDYRESDVDIELCVTANKAGNDSGDFRFHFVEPVEQMACMMVSGDFSNIAGAYRSFADWLENNSAYKMLGPNRQIVHRGPWNEKNPQEFLTEIQIPIERNSPLR